MARKTSKKVFAMPSLVDLVWELKVEGVNFAVLTEDPLDLPSSSTWTTIDARISLEM